MNGRSWIILACAIAIAGVFMLGAALDEVNFEPARPKGSANETPRALVLPGLSIVADIPLWQILAFWLALALNLGMVLLLLSPELRRRVLKQAVRFLGGVLLFLLILRYHVLQWPADPLEPPATGKAASVSPVPGADVPSFMPPQSDSWLGIAVGMLLSCLVLLGLFFAYQAWRRHTSRHVKPIEQLADIARASLADLAAGRQWSDVVIQAYAAMNAAVQRTRGLRRISSATPREFASRLSGTGLPGSAIDELTLLFESVRYGGQRSGAAAGERARVCLESIVRACEGVT